MANFVAIEAVDGKREFINLDRVECIVEMGGIFYIHFPQRTVQTRTNPIRTRDTTQTITENTKNAILRIGEHSHP